MYPRILFPIELIGQEILFDENDCRSFEGNPINGATCIILLPPILIEEEVPFIIRDLEADPYQNVQGNRKTIIDMRGTGLPSILCNDTFTVIARKAHVIYK
jgi:hypothetical protein